ncbi:MAG: hypothetical protein OHK0013_07520 [Sandaracinaceae bacterium]
MRSALRESSKIGRTADKKRMRSPEIKPEFDYETGLAAGWHVSCIERAQEEPDERAPHERADDPDPAPRAPHPCEVRVP